MTKARDISKLLSTANGKIAGENLDVSFENITDTGTEGTKVATGTQAQRGSTQGQLRFNTDTGLAEYYTGTAFKSIDAPPTISSIDVTEVDSQAGGNQTIIITGSGFNSGATVAFVGANGTDFNASTVTVDSATQITSVAPKASFLNAQEPYGVKVTNVSGLSNTLSSQINVDTSPSWSTASGTLATIGDTTNATHATVSATDPDGDTVSYSETTSVLSGAGLTLNSSSGTISGDPTNVASDTTYTFTLRATANSKTADRSFNIIVQKALDGSSSDRAVSHPDDIDALGLSSGSYYIQNLAGATRQVDVVINGIGNKNWVKLTPSNFFELITPSTDATTVQGWGTLNGRRYYRAYASSIDGEGWIRWALGSFSFRYITGTMGWAPNGSSLGTGHPDNDIYGSYHTGDTDFNTREYNPVSANRSWHRFGITNQFQLAYDELGFTGERTSEFYPIYFGQKTTNFKSGVSRVAGADNASSYLDLGSSAGNREFKWSACRESGVESAERIAWSPTEVLIS